MTKDSFDIRIQDFRCINRGFTLWIDDSVYDNGISMDQALKEIKQTCKKRFEDEKTN